MTKSSLSKICIGVLGIAAFSCMAGCGNQQNSGKPTDAEVKAFEGHKPTDEQLKAAMAQAMGKGPQGGPPPAAAPSQPTKP